jgi:hypothetical protein
MVISLRAVSRHIWRQNYPYKGKRQLGDLGTNRQSITTESRLSWQFPVEDNLESLLCVKASSVSNYSEVHATTIFRVKVHTLNIRSSYSLWPWRRWQHIPPKCQQHYPLSRAAKTEEEDQHQRDINRVCEGVDCIQQAQDRLVVGYCEHSNKPLGFIIK